MVLCGYAWSTQLPITWIINGSIFDKSAIQNSPLYQLNNLGTPNRVSLTVFSINGTTTFQCVVHSTSNTTTNSKRGTLTVTNGVYICMYICMHIQKLPCNKLHSHVCTYVCNCTCVCMYVITSNVLLKKHKVHKI